MEHKKDKDEAYQQLPACKDLQFVSGDGLIIPILFAVVISSMTFRAYISNETEVVADFIVEFDLVNNMLLRLKLTDQVSSTLVGKYTWRFFSIDSNGFGRTLIRGNCEVLK
jgi:hypothetical protein